MSDSNDSKTLLPEFLPTPNTTPGSDPRARVTARMKTLLRRTVVAGGAAVCMSCVSSDPLPYPADAALDGDAGRDTGPADALQDAAVDASTSDAADDVADDVASADASTDATDASSSE